MDEEGKEEGTKEKETKPGREEMKWRGRKTRDKSRERHLKRK